MAAQEDHEVVLGWAADHARAAYRDGVPPSQIIRHLMKVFRERLHYWNSVLFVVTGQRAFHLTIGECKEAEDLWRRGRDLDDAGIDAHFTPLIERNRPTWDR